MKRILFISPEPWYVEAHIEYLIRHLGNEYFMELAYPGTPETIKENPQLRNPDDYDLLVPLLPTHIQVDKEKYKDKLAMILWEPAEGNWKYSKIVAATTPLVVNSMKRLNHPYVEVAPGIDTELFKPYQLAREDDLLHVGVIGCPHNVRHRNKDVVSKLLDIPWVKFDFYVRNWNNRPHDIEEMGGEEIHKRIISGDKYWPGVPNVYNSVDLILRVDHDPGLHFPVLEAAACGKPFIATLMGIEDEFKSCGIVLRADEVDQDGLGRNWYIEQTDELVKRLSEAIEFMRDNPEARETAGRNGRERIETTWTWEHKLPKWREFFDRALGL